MKDTSAATIVVPQAPSSVNVIGEGSITLPFLDWRIGSNAILASVLLLVMLFLGHGFRDVGELGNTEDEARHALTGVFFADFIRDLPLRHPVDYTFRYYAQYPALGVVHWPPLFHCVEGVIFLMIGPSATAARLTVLLFLVVGLTFWFKLVAELTNVWAAAFATLALPLLPSLYGLERSVMLEIPALSLCLVASYFWIRVLRDARSVFLLLFAIFAGLALLTKEHSIYLAGFCVFTVVSERKWFLFLTWKTLVALAIAALLVVPYNAITFHIHSHMIAEHVVKKSGGYTIADLLFYVRMLPDMLGWPLLVLSGLGIVFSPLWNESRNSRIMLLWIAACYLTFTFLRARDSRYVIYWLPAFTYFATWPLVAKLHNRRSKIMAGAACVLVLGTAGYRVWQDHSYPYVAGYGEAVRWLTETAPAGQQVILYDGEQNGNFIFLMRTHDPNRNFVILRKTLYALRVLTSLGREELVHTPEQLQDIIRSYGIRYVMVSDDPRFVQFHSQVILRQLVMTPQFELVRSFHVVGGDGWMTTPENNLLVYENREAGPATAKYLRIPMMTTGRDIVVPFAALRRH